MKKDNKKRPVPWNILIPAASVLLVLIVLLIANTIRNNRIKSIFNRSGTISCLLVGTDEQGNNGRTDTILLGYFNTRTQKLGVVVVPRDMKVRIKGVYYDKINSIYSKQGLPALKRYLENLTGIPITFTAILDMQAFMKIIDIVGPLKIYNETAMRYVDNAQGLYIDLPSGDMELDGAKAMQYVRFRADERGDIGRSDRQLEILQLLVRKAVIERDFMKNVGVIRALLGYLKTNLTFYDAVMFLKHTSDFDFSNIQILKLPGSFLRENNKDYIIVEPEVARERTKEFYDSLDAVMPDFDPSLIKVQVLNGTSSAGLASKIRSRLLWFQYNVIEFGNAPTEDYKKTIVLDRSGNMQAARKVAEVIGCQNVYPKINRLMLVDVSVIIGEDMAPKKKAR